MVTNMLRTGFFIDLRCPAFTHGKTTFKLGFRGICFRQIKLNNWIVGVNKQD